jgi:MoaA/NifB/PqqE/SkfB family radical SAM enzyme
VNKSLSPFEEDALRLVENLKGKVPLFVYGGVYTEPLLNPYLPRFIQLTKNIGSNFGIHTNGSLLMELEEKQGFLSSLCRIATSKDYLSVSLDAGFASTHTKTKGLKKDYFTDIMRGIETVAAIRDTTGAPNLQVCYLLNAQNSSPQEIASVVTAMKKLNVDSLRFSIPYDLYGKPLSAVRRYRDQYETKIDDKHCQLLEQFMSKDAKEKPYIFYLPPKYQDVCRMTFHQCVYGYFQITIGADGYIYRCSSTATPTFEMNRLATVTSDLHLFETLILQNQDPKFDAQTCFSMGARCNRMALEINSEWERNREEA